MRKLEFALGLGRSSLREVANSIEEFYEPFDRKRRPEDKKWRHIDNPRGPLKAIQKKIQLKILRKIVLPETVVGGVKGKSIADNARFHLGKELLVTLDIRNCFPSTRSDWVFGVFRQTLGCSEEIARLLTRLTTFQHRLPQGAPTSSMILNLVLLPVHQQLADLAEEMDLGFSCYVDDVAFSGREADRAIEPAISLIMKMGFRVHPGKVQCFPRSRRQAVTGTVVNSKLSVGRGKVREIREAINDVANSLPIRDRDLRRIRGQIVQISSINSAQGSYLHRVAQKLLPDKGEETDAESPGIFRKCKSYRRNHRA